jgi:hypothetical protein
VTTSVSTINLPDGGYTKTGRKTQKKLFRVHFPYSRMIDDKGDGKGQSNLNFHRCIKNR